MECSTSVPVRMATGDDAPAIAAIYAPIVRDTCISFEVEPPSGEEMRVRIESTLERLPWLVAEDPSGAISGDAYASRHRERPAYRWSVDTSAYVRQDARSTGVGKALYAAPLEQLAALGYFQAFAGIALPNDASVALHESVGFQHLGTYRDVGFKKGAWHDVGWWQRRLRPAAFPAAPLAPLAPLDLRAI
jgi:L-amino acid N-acyltransferase YncA